MRCLALTIVAVAASACSGGSSGSNSSTGAGSSTGAPQVCIPGQSIFCAGPGDCHGSQVCAADGTAYLACDCGATSSSGTTGSTSGGTSSSSGGQTTGGGTGSTSGGISGTGTGSTSSGSTTGEAAIGQACGPTKSCPDSQLCDSTNESGNGYCTIFCGEGAFEPPDGGPQLCADTPTLGGTPGCNSYTTNSDGGLTWYCALICGNINGVEEGTCPANLTCTNHLCD